MLAVGEAEREEADKSVREGEGDGIADSAHPDDGSVGGLLLYSAVVVHEQQVGEAFVCTSGVEQVNR